MKIVEAQSGVLTNYEVYEFLNKQAEDYQKANHNGPDNLETLRKELLQYLESRPGPLSQKPLTYDEKSIPTLLQRLREYEITKGEMIMILNLRPTSIATLNTIVEDMESRFTNEQQEDIINGIIEVLGDFEAPAEEGEDMDMMQSTE